MKQIIQNFKFNGNVELTDFPSPMIKPGHIIIQTQRSLVSLGTERMLVEDGSANILEKVRNKPDRLNQVIKKIRTDGLLSTIDTVRTKLDQTIPLGYCNYGIVLESELDKFKVGDRVASNGPHAEIVRVPEKLVVKVPDNVSDNEAAFTVIGSIGLQGIRLLKPNLGETMVVFGLGLVGLITIQLLKASGVNVIGIDIDEKKCGIAESFGVKTFNSATCDPVKSVLNLTNEIGADGVTITAATKSNDVISQVAQMTRKQGRIILVGVVGLNINRADFYEKELSFQVSCSYGPGRYDENYEQKGIDYPLPYVRWTEKRNFEAVLHAISNGSLNVKDLVTEQVPLENYRQIYDNIGSSGSIASILEYSDIASESLDKKIVELKESSFVGRKGVIGIIGAGNFTKMTVLPALKIFRATLKYIASSGGMSGTQLAKKYGISHSTTDYTEILMDKVVDTVIITTRHNSHATYVIEALKAEKNVFVEKPLAITEEQLDEIISTYQLMDNPLIMVGFNRRFSPHLRAIKKSLGSWPGPINIVATMNAGFIPKDHWVHDLEIGGGRIIGEACHIMDVCVYLAGSLIKAVCLNGMGESPAENTDNASLLLRFENGTNAVINYFANGSKSYGKERIEVYSRERTWVIDNFKVTKAYGVKGFNTLKTKIDKGHKTQFHEYIKRVENGGKPLIPFDQLVNVTRASFMAIQSMKTNKWMEV